MSSDQYILVNGVPVIEPDLQKWGEFFNNKDSRRVDYTKIDDKIAISTVFLGIDHSFSGGPPILWETLIMGGEHDQDMMRCSGTIEDARSMHNRAVAMFKTIEVVQD